MSAGLLVEGMACKSAVLLCTSSGEIVKKIEGVPNFMQYARISDREPRRRIGDQGTLDPIEFIRGENIRTRACAVFPPGSACARRMSSRKSSRAISRITARHLSG